MQIFSFLGQVIIIICILLCYFGQRLLFQLFMNNQFTKLVLQDKFFHADLLRVREYVIDTMCNSDRLVLCKMFSGAYII